MITHRVLNVAGQGWIYYAPELVRVQLAKKEDFDGLVLRRFQHQNGEQGEAEKPATRSGAK